MEELQEEMEKFLNGFLKFRLKLFIDANSITSLWLLASIMHPTVSKIASFEEKK